MTTTLYAVTLDCADAARVAEFWAAALDRKVDDGASESFASIGMGEAPAARPHWLFIQVPEAKRTKNRMHVDLVSPRAADEVDRLVSLGATRLADHEEDGSRWTTLADPEGNEFDLLVE
jgi:predicted enzyme related to lactoylglutathione lyase